MTPQRPDPRPQAAVETKDPAARGLRAAEALLDEAPSANVRAAILRAATEHIRAQQTARAPARRAPWVNWLAQCLTWRPALPVAATMAVGVLAVALTVQIEREQPAQFETHAPATQTQTQTQAPATPPARDAGQETRPAMAPAPAPAMQAPKRALPQTPPEAPPTPRAGISVNAANAAADAASRASAKAAPAAPPAPAAPAAQLQSDSAASTGPSSQSGSATSIGTPSQTGSAAGAVAPSVATPAMAREHSAAARIMAAPSPVALPPPGDWLRRIIDLRKAHEDDAADRELAAFSRAYPDIKAPPEARRP